jgi:uncharacterized protein
VRGGATGGVSAGGAVFRVRTLDEILRSCSDTLFPAQIGRAPVQLNSVASDGDTPLHVMLWRDDTEAVLMLLKAGAKVNVLGDMSETPLHIAVKRQNFIAAEALLRAGADPDAVSEFGETPRTMVTKRAPKLRGLFK